MLGNLTGITNTNASEAINKKLQDEINELKNEVNTLEGEVDAISNNVDTNVLDANTGNIDNVNATSVSSTSVSATNIGATNVTVDNLTVNNTVDNLNVTNGNIQNVKANDVDADTLKADQVTVDQLTGDTATIDNLTVTSLKADTVDIGTITDDIDSENASIDDLTSINVTAKQINTDDIQADTGGIETLGATKITSNTVNATDVNATNISASDIDTLRVDASRMTSGIFSLNKDFFININANVNDIGVIKMPAFDGVARLSFVNSSEVEQLTMTIINNEVEKKQILVNFSQKAGRLNGFAISANNELLIGINGGNITKMYYTFDTSEEFNAIPEQLPITDFPNDVQYSWLVTSELSKTLCFIEPNTPTQGFEVTGMFKADSLEWTSVAIDNLDVIYDLTVRNDAYIGNDLHLKTFDIEATPITNDEVIGETGTGSIIGNTSTPIETNISSVTGWYYKATTTIVGKDTMYEKTGVPSSFIPSNKIKSKCIVFTVNGQLFVGDTDLASVQHTYGGESLGYELNPGHSIIPIYSANDNKPYSDVSLDLAIYTLDDAAFDASGNIADVSKCLVRYGEGHPYGILTPYPIPTSWFYMFGLASKQFTYDKDVALGKNGTNIYKRYICSIPAKVITNDASPVVNDLVYYYSKASYGAAINEGIRITDTRYPSNKVDLINAKAENAYTADYATKALQDNNGDQIDTTYQKVSEKAQPNGYASLDANGRIPYSQLPESAVEFKGTWDAATNTPTLPTGSDVKGDMYIVNVAGTQMGINWYVGDQAIYDGTTYQRISGSEVGVDTVNGLKDAVTIANSTVNGQTITVDKVQGQTVYSSTVTNLISNTPVGQTNVGYSNGTLAIAAGEELAGTWAIVCQKYDSTHHALTAVNTSNGRTFTRGYNESYWHEKKGFFYKNYYFQTDYSGAVGVAFMTSDAVVNHDISVSGYISRVSTSGITRVPFTAFVRGNGSNISVKTLNISKDISSWCKFTCTTNNNAIYFAIVCKPNAAYQRFTIELDSVMIGDVGSDTYAQAPNYSVSNASALLIWNGAWAAITPTVEQLATSTLTLAQYNALGTKAAGTLYLITG